MADTKQIDELFEQLLSTHRATLSGTELKEIDRFVAVGEYPLALQTAADIYRETGRDIPPETLVLLFGLADRMGIDRTKLLEGTNKKL